MAQVSRAAVGIPLLFAAGIVVWVLVSTLGLESRLVHRLEGPIGGSFPLPTGTRLVRIQVPEGQLSILPGDAMEVRFQGMALRAADTKALLAQLTPIEFTFRYHDGEEGVVGIDAPDLPAEADPRRQKMVLRAELWIPATIAVEATTTHGKLGAIHREAPVKLITGHGDLLLKQCSGDAVLRGRGGRVQVDMHRGNLDAEGGDKLSDFMMQIYMAKLGPDQLRVVNQRGPIQLWLPQDAEFELDLRAHAGKASNRFGIKPQPLGSRGVQMQGRVGNGGPRVYVESLDAGNVSVSQLPR